MSAPMLQRNHAAIRPWIRSVIGLNSTAMMPWARCCRTGGIEPPRGGGRQGIYRGFHGWHGLVGRIEEGLSESLAGN